MVKVSNIIAKETEGKSFKSHKFCYEEYDSPNTYENDPSFNPKKYGETDSLKKPRDIKSFADTIAKKQQPLFKYFLDGTRRTYKIDDISYGKRIYPIIAGQIGVGCCYRKSPDSFEVSKFAHKVLLSIPEIADKDGKGKSFLKDLCDKVNSESDISKTGINLSSILKYKDEIDANLGNLAIAKIQDEMIDLEKKFVVELTFDNCLNHDSYLIKDGSIEYQRMKTGDYKDLSVIKNSYRRVVGVSKRFNPELCVDSHGKSNASKIAELPLYHRSPSFMFESTRSSGEDGPVYISTWYLRIRETNFSDSPFDGVLKIEKIAVLDEEYEHGLDSSEIDLISANIINERNPVCYGKDSRWANHLYPVYLTERFIKSKNLSDNIILNIF